MRQECRLSFDGIGREQIIVGDKDITQLVRRTSVTAQAGEFPRLWLTIDIIDPSQVAGQMDVGVSGETAALLISLGWTPPPTEESKQAAIDFLRDNSA